MMNININIFLKIMKIHCKKIMMSNFLPAYLLKFSQTNIFLRFCITKEGMLFKSYLE
jgi:hypothetical protein